MRTSLLLACLLTLAACATGATSRIENRLYELGLSHAQAECAAGQLEERLAYEDLVEFARFTEEISTPDNGAREVFVALGRISNPEIAKAVAATSVSCALAR